MALRDNIKQWFQTGDKPTEGQFYTFFDSIFFKDEGIDISNITGLIAALNAKADQSAIGLLFPYKIILENDGTYILPAGLVMDKLIITPAAASTIHVGISEGGDEIMIEDDIDAGADKVVNFDLVARANTTIYFTGITSATTILLYRRTLISIN